MCIVRAQPNIYTQLIDDATGTTLVSLPSSKGKKGEEKASGGNVEAAKLVGKADRREGA